MSLERWFSAPWKEETIHGELRQTEEAESGSPGQGQVNRETASKRKGGGQEKGRFSEREGDQLCPLLLGSRPSATSGASHSVSTDLAKGYLGGVAQRSQDCSGLRRSQEESGHGETTLTMEGPRRESDKQGWRWGIWGVKGGVFFFNVGDIPHVCCLLIRTIQERGCGTAPE